MSLSKIQKKNAQSLLEFPDGLGEKWISSGTPDLLSDIFSISFQTTLSVKVACTYLAHHSSS